MASENDDFYDLKMCTNQKSTGRITAVETQPIHDKSIESDNRPGPGVTVTQQDDKSIIYPTISTTLESLKEDDEPPPSSPSISDRSGDTPRVHDRTTVCDGVCDTPTMTEHPTTVGDRSSVPPIVRDPTTSDPIIHTRATTFDRSCNPIINDQITTSGDGSCDPIRHDRTTTSDPIIHTRATTFDRLLDPITNDQTTSDDHLSDPMAHARTTANDRPCEPIMHDRTIANDRPCDPPIIHDKTTAPATELVEGQNSVDTIDLEFSTGDETRREQSPLISTIVYPPKPHKVTDPDSQICKDGVFPVSPPPMPIRMRSAEGGENSSPRAVKVQSRYANFLESTCAKALIRTSSMEDVVKKLSEGAYLWKIRGIGKYYNRHYKIQKDSMTLVAESKKWWSPGGLSASIASEGVETAVPIIDIIEIREGFKTDTFNKITDHNEKLKEKGMTTTNDPEIVERLCFSVIYGNSGREVLDLMADNEEQKEIWVSGLRFLTESVQSLHQDRVYDVWLRKKFESADKDNNGALNYNEVCSLLKSFNLKLDKKHSTHLFNQANTSKRKRDGDQVLDSQEFVSFYHSLLKMTEIENLYNKYINKETKVIGANELMNFFRKEQGLDNYQLNQVTSLIQESELSNLKDNDNLSFDGFYHLLLSDTFDIYNSDHVKNIYQDMTEPISHYYISSSHNTYLTGHQLAGESSVEGYISALKRGCRVVELDVWNGDDGEPIIYHGHTLTSKITFADVLRDAIKHYAFETSPYPVILSIENHLSVEQQVVMVKLLKDILGDTLLTDPVPKDLKVLPSPEDLKYKVIVKAKKPQGLDIEDDDEEDDDQDTIDFIDSDDGNASKKDKHHHKPMAPELSQVVNVCEGKTFVSFGTSLESDKCVHFPSLRENKAKSLLESSAEEFVKFTERQVAKIYPLGTRTDSSNLKPYPFWSVGAQVVTLNMQTEGKATFYNEAFFRRNKNCGYVLKPQFLVSKQSIDYANPPSELTKVLRVRIISGQHLPPSEKKNNIVDPYIQMKIRGHPMDKQKQKTSVIKNNGFNPVWNEELKATIRMSDVALIYFTVRDESSYAKDPVLALSCIPFTSLTTGYRHVHFTDINGKSVAPAAIFVHVSISDT